MSAITDTIFDQFGGHKAMAMIGGHAMELSETTLSVKWKAPANNKARKMTIRLEKDDTYTIMFYKLNFTLIEVLNDIYVDQLKIVFEDKTGLRLSLGAQFDGTSRYRSC